MKKKYSILGIVFIVLFITGLPVWAQDFMISDPDPQSLFDDTDADGVDWEAAVDTDCAGCFSVFNYESFTAPFIIENGASENLLYLSSLDRIGINTNTPEQEFHVEGDILSKNGTYLSQSEYPGFWLDETGAGNKGLYYTLDGKVLQIQRRVQGFGAFEASIVKLYLDAPTNAFFVKANGHIGFGRDPNFPIHSSTNAYLSASGQWVNASSREYKDNIRELSVNDAVSALRELNPVTYTAKADPEDVSAGFIAEEVPEIVATKDRKGLSPMDIVAVLTKVVQEQQRVNQEQQKTIAELSDEMREMKKVLRLKGSLASIEVPER